MQLLLEGSATVVRAQGRLTLHGLETWSVFHGAVISSGDNGQPLQAVPLLLLAASVDSWRHLGLATLVEEESLFELSEIVAGLVHHGVRCVVMAHLSEHVAA